MSRADKNTATQKKQIIYRDFLRNLDVHPLSGQLAVVTNEDSIKNSLRNLILINQGEIPYNKSKGSRLNHALFNLSRGRSDPVNRGGYHGNDQFE